MSKNPFLNALSATAYISLVASLMFYMPKQVNATPSVMIPIFVLSLFVFSTALMGYFFFYQPVQLLIEDKKEEATKLFLKTVFAFAGITGAMVLMWFLLTYNTSMDKIIINNQLGSSIWCLGWLFTIGYCHLTFWKGVLAILIWPYYIGIEVAKKFRN